MPQVSASLQWILLAPILGCGAGEDLVAPTSGSLEVITATANPPTDPQAYTVLLDRVTHSIGFTDTLSLTGLSVASHEVELAGLPAGCTTAGTNPRFVTVALNATTELVFQVLCPVEGPVADLQVSIVTVGSAPDADGYSLIVDEQASRAVGVNEELIIADLGPGLHHLRLADVAANCEVHDANPRVVEVPSVLEAGFAVTCVPPLAGVIAYSSGRGDDPFEDGFDEDIFLRNADGTSIRNLTNTPTEDERQPVWSPDGLQLAFMPLEGTDIFVMSADGSNRRLLLGGLDGAGGLQWSPDGTRLLFAQFNADFDAEVTMYSFSTNRLQVLARASVSESLSGFCWSHDGARVAYSVVDFEPEPRTSVLYTVSVAGGTPTQIVAVSGSELTLPAWSPDDGTIAFLQEGVDQRNDIYLVAADGSSPAVNLTNNPGVYRSLAWSPDGQTLAFSNGGLFSSVSNEGLFTIDRSGNLRQLTLNEARGISWSEDGSRLLFEESFEIYLINFDGTGRRAITADGFLNSEASWRP